MRNQVEYDGQQVTSADVAEDLPKAIAIVDRMAVFSKRLGRWIPVAAASDADRPPPVDR